jgi:hypothetical protein
MHAEQVSSLISDSGVTRYRLIADVWDVFSNAVEPYWYFPQGVFVEQFDSLFNNIGYIQADTAYYFEKKELWQVIGNVHIQNLEGDKFDTSELFWDRKAPPNSLTSIYTDSMIRIDQGEDLVIISKGLKANQSMTDFVMYDFYMEKFVQDEESKKDSIN